MEITEVRIKLMDDSQERLKAFCSITFDNCFVVRDLKIIEGASGPFVAMPSRKLTSHCTKCGMKNHLRAHYCNQCGHRLGESKLIKDADGRAKLYADIAHPINSACREKIQDHVIREYENELELASQPGYISRYDDLDGDYHHDDVETRRFDSPHDAHSAGRPHHPPSGDPMPRRASGAPHHPHGGAAAAESDHSTPSFGSGIFDD